MANFQIVPVEESLNDNQVDGTSSEEEMVVQIKPKKKKTAKIVDIPEAKPKAKQDKTTKKINLVKKQKPEPIIEEPELPVEEPAVEEPVEEPVVTTIQKQKPKTKCPVCDTDMLKSNLTRHLKSCEKRQIINEQIDNVLKSEPIIESKPEPIIEAKTDAVIEAKPKKEPKIVKCKNCGKEMPEKSLKYYHSLKCFPQPATDVNNNPPTDNNNPPPAPSPPPLIRSPSRAETLQARTDARRERLNQLIQSSLPKPKNKS